MSYTDCATLEGYKAHVRRNDAPCTICRDWKKRYDAGLAAKTQPMKSKRETALCGTPSGYTKHRRNTEPPCKPCREAMNEYKRENTAKKRGDKPAGRPNQYTQNLQPCGTTSAFQRHVRNNETPCDPCKAAKRAYAATKKAEWRAKEREGKPTRALKPCGTRAAAARHRRRNEPLCNPCRDAERADEARKRETKKAAACQ